MQELKQGHKDRTVSRIVHASLEVLGVRAVHEMFLQPRIFFQEDPEVVSGPTAETVKFRRLQSIKTVRTAGWALARSKYFPFHFGRAAASPFPKLSDKTLAAPR
jgi:protocatechuate 3,4-dioxygenase beta subunit